MSTATHIHKTRKWLLVALILGIILITYSLVMSPVPLAFLAAVAGIAFVIMTVVKLIAYYVHRHTTQGQTPAWRPGDTTE